MPPSLARSSGAPSRIGTIRLVAAWSDIHHSTQHASQQHHTNVQLVGRSLMIVVVGRSSTLLRIHKNHDKSSSKGGGTRYSTSDQNTPHAQYSMRYDEEIVHIALRRQQQLISSSALLVLFTVCTDVGSRTVVYHWWQNLALLLPQDCKKKHCTLIIHAHLML